VRRLVAALEFSLPADFAASAFVAVTTKTKCFAQKAKAATSRRTPKGERFRFVGGDFQPSLLDFSGC